MAVYVVETLAFMRYASLVPFEAAEIISVQARLSAGGRRECCWSVPRNQIKSDLTNGQLEIAFVNSQERLQPLLMLMAKYST